MFELDIFHKLQGQLILHNQGAKVLQKIYIAHPFKIYIWN